MYIYFILFCRTKITILEVNENLDKIVLLNAQKKGVNEILFDMFRKMDSMMFKWLVRIILKDVKIGLGQKALFSYFHGDANDLYDTNANFRKVSESCSIKVIHNRLHLVFFISNTVLFKPLKHLKFQGLLLIFGRKN